jgi:Tfp pilus assembly protein PilN
MPASLLFYFSDARGRTEVYGESEARGVFSGEFPFSRERSLAIARGELRLAADVAERPLREGLPGPDGSVPVLAYAAALAGSVSRTRRLANLLPPERRASHDRVQYLLPAALGLLTVLAMLTALVILPAVSRRQYRNELALAARRLEPAAARTQTIERAVTQDRARIGALDDLRRRPQADLDVLNELTRILPPEIWTNTIEIYPDSVVIAGEAPQAAPLLRLLDSSPLFQNSEFSLGVSRTQQQTEMFRIRTMRRGRIGRVTP